MSEGGELPRTPDHGRLSSILKTAGKFSHDGIIRPIYVLKVIAESAQEGSVLATAITPFGGLTKIRKALDIYLKPIPSNNLPLKKVSPSLKDACGAAYDYASVFGLAKIINPDVDCALMLYGLLKSKASPEISKIFTSKGTDIEQLCASLKNALLDYAKNHR